MYAFPSLTSLILALIYLLTCVLFLIRTWKLYCRAWPQVQVFYATVTMQAVLRTAAFLLQAQDVEISEKAEYVLLYLPDSLFLVGFLVLFWLLLMLEQRAHMDLGNAKSAGPFLRSVATHMWKAIALWVFADSLCYLLYLLDVCNSEIKSFELAVANIVLPILVLVSQFALQITYSGIPFKSRVYTKRHYIVGTAALIWSIGREVRGVVGVLWPEPVSESVQQGSNVSEALFIAVLLTTEIGCYLAVLDYGQTQLFHLSPEDEDPQNDLLSGEYEDLSGFTASHQLIYDSQEVECTHEMPSRHHALGRVFLAKFREQIVLYRRVNFKRLSSFVQEEVVEDLQALKQVTSEHIVPFLGCTLDGCVLGLLSTYYHQGSLYSLLHEAKEELSDATKVRIARDLSMGLRDLHYQNQSHGHLTSHNVLLEGDKVVMISDFGLERMKKFAGLMCGYCNKNGWTSPEQLTAEGPVAWQVKESDDVYSFGVVLWELMTEQVPFPDLPPEDLSHVVAEQNNRPELTPDINEVLTKLIKSCWNISPAKRPSFKLIYSPLCLVPIKAR